MCHWKSPHFQRKLMMFDLLTQPKVTSLTLGWKTYFYSVLLIIPFNPHDHACSLLQDYFCNCVSGIGYETAKWIAMMGAKVILAVRSEERGISVCVIEGSWVGKGVIIHLPSWGLNSYWFGSQLDKMLHFVKYIGTEVVGLTEIAVCLGPSLWSSATTNLKYVT